MGGREQASDGILSSVAHTVFGTDKDSARLILIWSFLLLFKRGLGTSAIRGL